MWREGEAEPTITNMAKSAYFVLVTLSTVGYGDYTAVTVIGRALVIVFILFGVLFFADNLSKV